LRKREIQGTLTGFPCKCLIGDLVWITLPVYSLSIAISKKKGTSTFNVRSTIRQRKSLATPKCFMRLSLFRIV